MSHRAVNIRRRIAGRSDGRRGRTSVLSSTFMGLSAAVTADLSTKYSDYITGLGGTTAPGVSDGIAVGQASANDLDRRPAGDRKRDDLFNPGR